MLINVEFFIILTFPGYLCYKDLLIIYYIIFIKENCSIKL